MYYIRFQIGLALMLLSACASDPVPTVKTPVVTPTEQVAAQQPNDPNSKVPEPAFMQEGRLAFLAPNGKSATANFEIEIADNSAERSKGLMFRRSMEPGQAMLFEFDQMAPQGFWMRNTYIPLDIIYINDQLEVVSIQKNCKILNDQELPSEKPAMYVLEINGGLSDKLGIRPGSRIAWQNFVTGQTMGNYAFPAY